MRSGARTRRGHVVVHVAPDLGRSAPAVGLVVGKAVGASVTRHRVSRRLRHAMAERLSQLPSSSATVIRALPGAADDSWNQLCADLDAALTRVLARG